MSTYGTFRTRTFGEIFPNVTTFKDFYTNCGIPATLFPGTETVQGVQVNTIYKNYDIDSIYSLLASEYFGAHISYSSEDWWKLKVMQTIYAYGNTWQREMAIQDKIKALSDEEIKKGAKAVYNHASHPSQEPDTQYLEDLPYIDDQNTTNWKKEPIRAFAESVVGLNDRLTREFLLKFKKLFIRFVYPTGPIFYKEGEDYNEWN